MIGTSVGIALGPSNGTSPDQLIRNADLALYRAKGDGRGTYRFFEQEMDSRMQERRRRECRPSATHGRASVARIPAPSIASPAITMTSG